MYAGSGPGPPLSPSYVMHSERILAQKCRWQAKSRTHDSNILVIWAFEFCFLISNFILWLSSRREIWEANSTFSCYCCFYIIYKYNSCLIILFRAYLFECNLIHRNFHKYISIWGLTLKRQINLKNGQQIILPGESNLKKWGSDKINYG